MKTSKWLAATSFALFSTTVLAHNHGSAGVKVNELAEGLVHPWGMVQLPNGDFIINERPGTMARFSAGTLSDPISGVPEVVAQNQGGLLGITADPNFAEK